MLRYPLLSVLASGHPLSLTLGYGTHRFLSENRCGICLPQFYLYGLQGPAVQNSPLTISKQLSNVFKPPYCLTTKECVARCTIVIFLSPLTVPYYNYPFKLVYLFALRG